jgi:hypothetical protein
VTQFVYGAPSAPVIERPRCWGRSFDEMSSECRRCGFQNSCKDEIIRCNINRPAPMQQYQAPYGPAPAVPYTQPMQAQPVVFQQQQQVAGFRPQFQQQQQIQHQPPQQLAQEAAQRAMLMNTVQPMQQPPYGWLHDPLYYTMAATPPPVRPQMTGEGFVERVVKNAGLAMVEALFGQCFLAVRQLILPPRQQEKPVIDVTPPGVQPPFK